MEDKKPKKLTLRDRIASLSQDAVASAIGAILGAIASVATTLASFEALKEIPPIYLTMFLIAFGLTILLGIGVILYKRQMRRRQMMIRRLKEAERELFESIEVNVSSLLREEVG